MPSQINNPTTTAPGGGTMSAFFGFLGGVADMAKPLLQNKIDEETARSKAKQQEILNRNHQIDPSVGPNDPTDAQRAANKTFLEKFLPGDMLYQTDPVSNVRTPTGAYYMVMVGIFLFGLLLLRRLWK